MRARLCTGALLASAAAIALGGCGSTRLLALHSSSTASTATTSSTTSTAPASQTAAQRYLVQLRAAEAELAAAERSIPSTANTPQALSRSASLLANAVSRLASSLSAISPPPSVASEHADLVAIVRVYAQRLRAAAATALAPNGQVRADTLLISATNQATAEFNTTLAKIYSTLGVRQP